MIPSASSTGDLSAWHTDSWADHTGAAAAAAAIASTAYDSSSAAPAADHSRYLGLHRHQILDWENAMLLASSTHHSNACSEAVYDHVTADYNKAAGIPPAMHADVALASLSHSQHYEDLLSAHMASSANSVSFANNNAWGLLNNVCSRTSGSILQQESSLLQAAGAQYNSYETLNGADGLGAYGSLGTAAAASLYADSLRSSSSSSAIGLTSFDQRRLDDIMKRELYTTHDLNSRLGLNLGGRTYFSADDFAFGRWGKRLRPNSPGCMMQPAPLCQAEGCKADLSMAKHYHRRHKVCEYHSKAATVHIGDQTQRFCQQCSRFHVLDEFDDGKRSCRKRLADHNRRRRKPQPTPASTAAEPTTTGAAAGDANADDEQPNKEPSQEATPGSDSFQTGAQPVKDSPLPASEDQPKSASTSTPTASSMANHNEATSGGKNVNDQEKHQKQEQSKDSPASTKALLNSSGNRNRIDMTIASPKTSDFSANLSLGGTTDLPDVKPANQVISASIIDAHDGSPFENSLSISKHAVGMPWLHGSKKPHNIQEIPYNENTIRTAANEAGGDRAQYATFKTTSPAGFKESHRRGSWMIKDVTGAGADGPTDALLLNTKSGSSETGGHELLRLLGDERDLLSNNKHASRQENTGSSIGTLAFMGHSLDQSVFARSDQHRMLHLSNLQSPDVEQQAAMSLNRGLSSSLTFDGHNHMA